MAPQGTTSGSSKVNGSRRASLKPVESSFARSTASSRSRSSNAGLPTDEDTTHLNVKMARRSSHIEQQRRKSMVDSVRSSRRMSTMDQSTTPTPPVVVQAQHRSRANSLAIVSSARRPSAIITSAKKEDPSRHSVILRRRKPTTPHSTTANKLSPCLDETSSGVSSTVKSSDAACRSQPRGTQKSPSSPSPCGTTAGHSVPVAHDRQDATTKPIRLFDAWRDTLATKQRLAKEDLLTDAPFTSSAQQHLQGSAELKRQQQQHDSSLLARRRSTVLAAANSMPQHLLHTHLQHPLTSPLSSPDIPPSASSSLQRRRHITPPSTSLLKINTPSGKNQSQGSPSPSSSPIRPRKKSLTHEQPLSSMAAHPLSSATLARRRRSRTESLKEGVPTVTSTTTVRLLKKSIVSESRDSPSSHTKKFVGAPPNYTRKRGKVKKRNVKEE
ncbi:hypothetical protein DM01DRAFT_1340188 [Hesseltinella vesiculosa]|uniref:Uncharacterized protein n=1 Tax=Hesseltinella vesiculosa TaxID=101127 RepID=A0A1X2G4Y3_9FUNG|nr:hypothetical protein DM01DRAFT_1340188 [Hesseltinella vesiculosa]